MARKISKTVFLDQKWELFNDTYTFESPIKFLASLVAPAALDCGSSAIAVVNAL